MRIRIAKRWHARNGPDLLPSVDTAQRTTIKNILNANFSVGQTVWLILEYQVVEDLRSELGSITAEHSTSPPVSPNKTIDEDSGNSSDKEEYIPNSISYRYSPSPDFPIHNSSPPPNPSSKQQYKQVDRSDTRESISN